MYRGADIETVLIRSDVSDDGAEKLNLRTNSTSRCCRTNGWTATIDVVCKELEKIQPMVKAGRFEKSRESLKLHISSLLEGEKTLERYTVMMRVNGEELEMRGRCSAGNR